MGGIVEERPSVDLREDDGLRRFVGCAIVNGDGKPVVIDASGSDDKRVRMVSFFTMIMYPLFIYIYI